MLVIELSSPTDADEIGDLYISSRAAALPFIRDVHRPEDVRWWIGTVLLPAGTTWVARLSGALCGIMTLNGEVIEQLYLWPHRRREGIGRSLVAHAKALSPARLRLICFAANHAARAFYEAEEFVPVEFRDGCINEEGSPDIVYEWTPSK